jgi:hypothetical protein
MRHTLTIIIAFHWMAVFALLATVSTLDPENGIFAALSLLGAAPTPDAVVSGGGLLASGFLSFAFAVAGVLFLWTLATALFSDNSPHGDTERVARIAFGAGVGVFSLLLLCGASPPVPGLFPACAMAIAALLASYLAVFAERWSATIFAAPNDSDLSASVRVMAAGAAHSAMLGHISGRTRPAAPRGAR